MNNKYIKIILAIAALISLLLTNVILPFFNTSFTNVLSGLVSGRTNDLYLALGTFIILFGLLTLVFLMVSKKVPSKHNEKGSKKLGSSKFASLKELNNVTGTDGLIIGEKVRLSMDHSFSHHGLVGVTGSGKSSSYFIPNLISNPKTSFIVTDPKGELFEKTAKENMKQGKRVLVFSPFKEETLKYNPLLLCKNITEIRELAQSLLANGNASVEAITGQKSGGSEWINMSTPLLTAFLIFVRELDAPKNTVTYALDLIIENDIETLEFILEGSNEAAVKQFNIFMQSAGSEQTASSIKSVLSSNLQMFVDPLITNLTSENEIDPRMLREKPTVLYVVVPEQKSDFMAPLMASFYSQMIGRLMEVDGAPIYMFLDEFANIGVINNIDKYLAVVRSRKISISIGIQSLNQLKQRYGQDASGTILDNLKTKSILPGSAFETANYFSQLIGNEEVSSTSSNFSGKDKSYSENKQRKELMSADEIRRLPDGKILVLTDNKNPFLDNQERYYLKEEYVKKTKDTLSIDKYVNYYRRRMQEKRG